MKKPLVLFLINKMRCKNQLTHNVLPFTPYSDMISLEGLEPSTFNLSS